MIPDRDPGIDLASIHYCSSCILHAGHQQQHQYDHQHPPCDAMPAVTRASCLAHAALQSQTASCTMAGSQWCIRTWHCPCQPLNTHSIVQGRRQALVHAPAFLHMSRTVHMPAVKTSRHCAGPQAATGEPKPKGGGRRHAISRNGHTVRGRVRQKGSRHAELLEAGSLRCPCDRCLAPRP